MKKIISFFAFVLVVISVNFAKAAVPVNLTIRDGNSIIFSGEVPLKDPGSIDVVGHSLDADSVLSVINDADTLSSDFSISDLQYFDSYSSFYLKCIQSSVGNHCENWQYTVNDIYPGIGMDKKILSGGENLYVYFGPQYKTVLSANQINSNDSVTATSEEYDYKNNAWVKRKGVTLGVTAANPSDPFNPTEVMAESVDGNGQAIFSSIPVGTYGVGIKEDFYFPTEKLEVKEAPETPRGGGGGGLLIANPATSTVLPEVKEKGKFDLNKALEFIISKQKENGSFDEDLYNDWIALALSSSDNFQEQRDNLLEYLSQVKTTGYQLTDYERHSMALMALGANPYNVNGENFIAKITSSFDGKQFGDPNQDNDDIFALIVLKNSGFALDEKILTDDVNFILSKQKENGSWDNSIDMTGAAITTLSSFKENEQVKNALLKAEDYLKQNQKDTGGWENASSTSWVIGAITSLSEKFEDWIKGSNSPLDYFGKNQDDDGGIKNENFQNKLWQTAYAVTALSGKTWNELMQKFEKPKEPEKSQPVEIKKDTAKNNIKKIKKQIPQINIKTENKEVQTQETPNIPQIKTEKSWIQKLWDKIFGN